MGVRYGWDIETDAVDGEDTADDKFCGLASQLTPLQNGSQIRSRKHAVGSRLPAT
ncbi:hypothetical protein V1289_006395 [Bradyrhizobium sp. AZCC 2289]